METNTLFEQKKKAIRVAMEKGIVLPPSSLSLLSTKDSMSRFLSLVSSDRCLQEDVDRFFSDNQHDTKKQATSGQQKPPEKEPVKEGTIKISNSFGPDSAKRSVQDFVSYFNSRYVFISSLLRARQELRGAISINRIKNLDEREQVSFIGIVFSKQETKNNNFILSIEDATGTISVLITKNNPEIYNQAKDVVLDEVIGITGTKGKGIIYAKTLIWPDIPLNKELKKAPEESYAIFLSDIHVGSNNFLKNEFERFIGWLNGEVGTEEQKLLVKKIKYCFFVGDMIDGVGIYPNQEAELVIPDVAAQYAAFAEYLKRFPKHIKIIISSGNHDATRLAEPQPPPYKDFAGAMYALPNIYFVSNPSTINIGSTHSFSGIDVLLYHGYSFDYYIAEVDHIRNEGGYDRADLVMKFLLTRRHLAPTHSSTLYAPVSPDPLLIRTVPDVFVSGHIHKASASMYKNVTLLSGSCWQKTTPFQKKVGHHPEPARVPLLNLQTRKVKILRFQEDENE